MNDNLPTSDLNDFEKQINEVIDLDVHSDKPTPKRLSETGLNKIEVKPVVSQQPVAQQNLVKVKKNIVLCFISDATGCGFIRCFQPFSYLNFVFGKTQTLMPIISCAFLQDENILLR